jgi:hypothetical protein
VIRQRPAAVNLIAVALAALLLLTGQPSARPGLRPGGRPGDRALAASHDGQPPPRPVFRAKRPEASSPTSYRAPVAVVADLGRAVVIATPLWLGPSVELDLHTSDALRLPMQRGPPSRPSAPYIV